MDRRQRIQLLVGALVVGTTGLLTAMVVARTGTREVTLPAETRIVGALQQTVSTRRNGVGDGVSIRSNQPIRLDGETAIPPGVVLEGEITHIKGGGRLTGAPELTIRFTRLDIDDKSYSIRAVPFRVRGRSSTPETAAEIGGGAVVGGVIGALSGSTLKGAAIGAVIGTGVAIATPGDQITLPAGQRLRVQLTEPVTVRFKPVEPRERERETARSN